MYLGLTIVAGNLETERKQRGETGIRQKRNVTPESIGLVSIKAQADISTKLRCFRFLQAHTLSYCQVVFFLIKPG